MGSRLILLVACVVARPVYSLNNWFVPWLLGWGICCLLWLFDWLMVCLFSLLLDWCITWLIFDFGLSIRLLDWVFVWFVDCLIGLWFDLMDWLDWCIDCLVDWMLDSLIDWVLELVMGCLIGWLVDWFINAINGLIDWLVVWQVDLLDCFEWLDCFINSLFGFDNVLVCVLRGWLVFVGWLCDSLIAFDWLFRWFAKCIDSLVDWLVDRLIAWVDWLVCCFLDWLVCSLRGWLVDTPTD